MSLDSQFETALSAQEPVPQLRSLAEKLFAEGHEKTAVLRRFEEARQQLREADREKDEDAVMDVMDFLNGWCSPHMRLGVEQEVPGKTDS